jgi:hypothetical protein
MTTHSDIPLNSASIAALWTTYLNDSMAACVLKHFLKNVEDEDIRTILNDANNICNGHIQTVAPILSKAEIALPIGFTDSDVDLKAPRLFTDTFYLFYLANMSQFGMTNFSLALYHAARTDIRKFFLDSLTEVANFYYRLSDLMLAKGVFIRAPIVSVTKSSDIVDKKNFFSGIFSQPRSLILTEVFNVFTNMLACYTGRTILQGFSQTAKSTEVRKVLSKGKKMLEHHIEVFSNILKSEGIPVPSTSDMSVTDSILPTISDRLMLFHVTMLNVVNMRNYTEAMSASLRNDLNATFVRLSAEVAEFANEGINILVDNGWFEQPPQVVNHDKLVGIK